VYPHTGDGEGDGAFSADRLVAHWSLPFELELVAQEDPPPGNYPTVYFQVSSYDSWDRYRCEGYGHLQLSGVPLGSAEHRIKTWKVGGSIRDRVATHFIGGTPEIGDVTYAGMPRDAKSIAVHSRLGFVADSSGEIKAGLSSVQGAFS
jgi:Meckel syndrome type 1 protein